MKIMESTAKLLLPLVLVVGIGLGLTAQPARVASVQHFAMLAESIQPLDSSEQTHNSSGYLVTAQNSSLSGSGSILPRSTCRMGR